mmetsp:Transcript_7485/g.21155  ORF Transcript_7485/g.21155 Transcript_7485/m.21155 type:complete len:417 (-) Transcript_7485:2050-3300(-)
MCVEDLHVCGVASIDLRHQLIHAVGARVRIWVRLAVCWLKLQAAGAQLLKLCHHLHHLGLQGHHLLLHCLCGTERLSCCGGSFSLIVVPSELDSLCRLPHTRSDEQVGCEPTHVLHDHPSGLIPIIHGSNVTGSGCSAAKAGRVITSNTPLDEKQLLVQACKVVGHLAKQAEIDGSTLLCGISFHLLVAAPSHFMVSKPIGGWAGMHLGRVPGCSRVSGPAVALHPIQSLKGWVSHLAGDHNLLHSAGEAIISFVEVHLLVEHAALIVHGALFHRHDLLSPENKLSACPHSELGKAPVQSQIVVYHVGDEEVEEHHHAGPHADSKHNPYSPAGACDHLNDCELDVAEQLKVDDSVWALVPVPHIDVHGLIQRQTFVQPLSHHQPVNDEGKAHTPQEQDRHEANHVWNDSKDGKKHG